MNDSVIPTINHHFVGRREDGIFPTPDAKCQECGYPRNQHIDRCSAILCMEGMTYQCDLVPPHDGWGHQNREIQVVWS